MQPPTHPSSINTSVLISNPTSTHLLSVEDQSFASMIRYLSNKPYHRFERYLLYNSISAFKNKEICNGVALVDFLTFFRELFGRSELISGVDSAYVDSILTPNIHGVKQVTQLYNLYRHSRGDGIMSYTDRCKSNGESKLYSIDEGVGIIDNEISMFFNNDDPSIDTFINSEAGCGKTHIAIIQTIDFVMRRPSNRVAIYVPTVLLGEELLAKFNANIQPGVNPPTVRHIKGKRRRCNILNGTETGYSSTDKDNIERAITSSIEASPCSKCDVISKCEYYRQYTNSDIRIYSHAHYYIPSECEPNASGEPWIPNRIIIDEDIIINLITDKDNKSILNDKIVTTIKPTIPVKSSGSELVQFGCKVILEEFRKHQAFSTTINTIEKRYPHLIRHVNNALNRFSRGLSRLQTLLHSESVSIKPDYIKSKSKKSWIIEHLLEVNVFRVDGEKFEYYSFKPGLLNEGAVFTVIDPTTSTDIGDEVLQELSRRIIDDILAIKLVKPIGLIEVIYEEILAGVGSEVKFKPGVFWDEYGSLACMTISISASVSSRMSTKHLYLDATSNQDVVGMIYHNVIGRYKSLRWVSVPIKYSDTVSVNQVLGCKTTRNALTNACPVKLKQLVDYIKTIIDHTGSKDPGLISYLNIPNANLLSGDEYMKFDKYLAQSAGIDTYNHFGAIRGKNTFEHCDLLIVVGREMINPAAIVDISRMILALQGLIPKHVEIIDDSIYINQSQPKLTNSKGELYRNTGFEGHNALYILDDTLRNITKHVCDGETLQAMHRLRLLHPASKAKTVVMINDCILNANIDIIK